MSQLHRFGRAARLALILAAAAFPAAAAISPHHAGELTKEVRSVRTAGGEDVAYETGTIFVPENRGVADSRLIGIGYARIRGSAAAQNGPPLFLLSGGPGSSYLDLLTGSAGNSPVKLSDLLAFRPAGDIVLIDQRGYSARGDRLTYAHPPWDLPLDRPASLAAEAKAAIASANIAVAANPGKDLSGYTIVQCAEDVNDLRRALGYEKLTLVGQSFGSQWAFAIMRLHPEIVERALLSGVEPLDNGYDMPSHVFAALQRIAWSADRDPGLQPYLPKGGLMAALQAVRDRLARSPVTVKVRDPRSGGAASVTLGLSDFQRDVVGPAEAWPAWVLSLYHRRYEDWASEVIAERHKGGETDALIAPLIDTSLGVSPEREHLLRTDPAGAFLGAWGFAPDIAAAPTWPTPDMGDGLRRVARSEIPVLFVHGDWDTETPVENTLSMLPYFPHGRAILVHQAGHGARFLLMAQRPELRDQILRFLGTGDADGLPSETSLPPPPFERPAFPPPERRGAGS
ncbi:hypothetical protein C5708_18865 [Caulobacter sp. CCUG 60055]|uniref:alpha/beta fold hydrolase n=1 Tax=Caulobacter sp. CCUG 60055 TaxID=2100090 RepID=UPI001FA7F18B|nr:alpha/beta fold hydrolase [Caulobacter sp. CCUG 60055]MCI3182308.1 hypothetical protein [Caulobacter sp. CCUG 60055]